MFLTIKTQNNYVLISNPPCGECLQKRMNRDDFRLPLSPGCSLVLFNCTECIHMCV